MGFRLVGRPFAQFFFFFLLQSPASVMACVCGKNDPPPSRLHYGFREATFVSRLRLSLRNERIKGVKMRFLINKNKEHIRVSFLSLS